MTNALHCAVPLLWVTLLAGCVDPGDYPSLAPRPIERGETAPSPPPEAPVAAADPALSARLAQLIAQAHEGDMTFARALEPARASVRRAGAAGSESWIVAQEAVSRLESARTRTVEALSELDALARERNQGGPADINAIAAATAEVSALVDAQQEKIGGLTGSLPTG